MVPVLFMPWPDGDPGVPRLARGRGRGLTGGTDEDRRSRRLAPEILEAIRPQLGVAHCVLNVAVAEVSLQRAGIVALVGERITAGMAQHVRLAATPSRSIIRAKPVGPNGAPRSEV